VSQNRVRGARGWRSHTALAGLIVLLPFLLSPSATGQAMSDMPGMEHQHHGTAAAPQRPPATTARGKRRSQPAQGAQKSSPAISAMKHQRARRSTQVGVHKQHAMPGMQHGEHGLGAMPGMEHGEHGMGRIRMQGQFGPYTMSREASGTSWQPDSSPHQGVMFMSNEWMLMGHANLFGVYDHQGGLRGGNKGFAAGMVMGMAQRPLGDNGTLGAEPLRRVQNGSLL
jgi:hypothetical protein